jgi:hypothetical protein
MEFRDLLDFIRNKMRMSHIYQPLLIRLLVESGGQATLRQLAKEFSAFDEAQILMYESRLKKMPVSVLKRHEVVTKNGNLITLNVNELSLEERRAIISECEERITEFIKTRGLTTWSGLLDLDPVPESIRYQVLKRDRRCVLCGAKPDAGPLQVDHIVPRSQGGSNEPSNLQVLCALCNRGKSNRDDEDFRPPSHSG